MNNPTVKVIRHSPNISSRHGQKIRLIVLHASEARRLPDDQDLRNLGDWFADRSSQVSAHVATNGAGHSARYVSDQDKAWHCVSYNSASLGIEQIGHTTDPSWPSLLLHETARWIAHWSREHNIPIRRARVIRGHVVRSGVIRHSDLGAPGGNHDDPGSGYSFDAVLRLAAHYR